MTTIPTTPRPGTTALALTQTLTRTACSLLLAALAPGQAAAADAPPRALADPTRPPAWMATGATPGALPTAAPGTAASRAPARPNNGAAGNAAAPVLQAVMLPRDDSPASALIDQRLVRVGDAVGGWTVAAIEADAVLLRQGERRWRAPLLSAFAPAEPPAVAQASAASSPPARTLPRTARGTPGASAPLAAAGLKEP